MPATFLRPLLLSVLLCLGATASAQDILGGEEGETVEDLDIPGAVLDTLRELTSDGPDPARAVTTEDPEVDLATLEFLLLPLPLDAVEDETAAWHELVSESVEEMASANLELLEHNRADDEAAADGLDPASAEGQERQKEKEALVEKVSERQDARTLMVDRFKAVIEEMEDKGGDPDEIAGLRQYVQAVSGVTIDISDTETAVNTIQSWITSEEGGRRLLRNCLTFLSFILGSVLVGRILAWVLNAGMRRTSATSKLQRRFVWTWVRRFSILIGILLGLAALGVNVSPLLAAMGALGFVLAFALQSTLSNFASGLLIMLQKPFDVGDDVEAAEISGTVEKVSLFSTHMSTEENKKVIVPNNMIWDGIIVNATGSPTRRLSIEIEVNAEEHSLDEAERILLEVMSDHPDVLKDPAPEVKLSGMSKEQLTFVCWPWVPTDKKDQVRWELVASFGRHLSVLRGATKAAGA